MSQLIFRTMTSNKKYYLLKCQLALCNTLIALRILQSKKKKKKKKGQILDPLIV